VALCLAIFGDTQRIASAGFSILALIIEKDCEMTRQLVFNATWLNWIMLAVALLMTAEYVRLILFTDTATYRIFVFFVWVGISLFSLARIIHARRQNVPRGRINESRKS